VRGELVEACWLRVCCAEQLMASGTHTDRSTHTLCVVCMCGHGYACFLPCVPTHTQGYTALTGQPAAHKRGVRCTRHGGLGMHCEGLAWHQNSSRLSTITAKDCFLLRCLACRAVCCGVSRLSAPATVSSVGSSCTADAAKRVGMRAMQHAIGVVEGLGGRVVQRHAHL
jgi:hypothetical protein